MAPPRYLFTARVVPSTAGGDPRIAWRLVGGNNHELGRSFDSFTDLTECVDAVHRLQEQIGRAGPEATTSGSEWGWVLRIDGADVAVSCRWYRRARESQYNLLQFLAAAPSAGLSDVVGTPPPRRELLRPDYLVPHQEPADVLEDAALTQDLPVDLVEEVPISGRRRRSPRACRARRRTTPRCRASRG